MVECQLPKLDVAGSSPVSRSILFNNFQRANLAPLVRLESIKPPERISRALTASRRRLSDVRV